MKLLKSTGLVFCFKNVICVTGKALQVACMVLLVNQAYAQSAQFEIEPNNTPAQANPISGETLIMGAMGAGDQDGFIWTVSDVDAQKRWTLELSGIPGELTVVDIFRIEWADNGVDVAAQHKLLSFGSRDGSKPAVLENLIFEPGEYILGLAHAGGGGGAYRPPVDSVNFGDLLTTESAEAAAAGAYRLAIREGTSLNLRTYAKGNGDKQTAQDLRSNEEFSHFVSPSESWYQLDINDKLASQRWDLKFQVPVGRASTGQLLDDAGEVMSQQKTDRQGKLRFPDLSLAAGSYFLKLSGEQGDTVQIVSFYSTGLRIDGAEAEPNDQWKLANRADFSQAVSGRMGVKSETDFFVFDIDPTMSDQQFQLVLDTGEGEKYRFCLHDENGADIQCRDGESQLILPDLVLAAGTWGLSAGRGSEGSEYTISLEAVGDIKAGVEVEPNDRVEFAATVPANNRIKGRIFGRDDDFYRFIINEKPQLWRFQVIGDQIHELAFLDGSGNQSQVFRVAGGQTRVQLENVYLLPGVHYIRVSGVADANYTLLARPLGPPDPNGEFEPNDDSSRMQVLDLEQTRTGLLSDIKDIDMYRFDLAQWDNIAITIEPPVDGEIVAQLQWGEVLLKDFNNPQTGQKVVLEGVFPPGDYTLLLRPQTPSVAEYKLSLNRLNRFSCATDCEPNDNLDFANPLPASHILQGRSNEWRDYDWYQMPVFGRDTDVVIKSDPRQQIAIEKRQYTSQSLLEWDAESSSWRGVIPAETETFIKVPTLSEQDYRFELQIDAEAPTGMPSTAPRISLTSQFAQATVAAYRPYAQVLPGELIINNNGTDEATVKLETVSSDYRWKVENESNEIQLKAGESGSVPITVKVPADAWSNRPVRISSRAILADGRQVESFADLQAEAGGKAINPVHGFDLPAALLGGPNVAWSALGAQWIDGYDGAIGRGFEMLFDELAVSHVGMQLRGGTDRGPIDITVKLPGDSPMEIVGFSFDLMGFPNNMQYLKNLEVQLSTDGQQFTTVLETELQPLEAEQPFVLPEPVLAGFARLRMKNSFDGTNGSALTLGEFKVIAKPGTDPSAGRGYNLASPGLGGHVVYSNPALSAGWDELLLEDDKAPIQMKFNANGRQEFVIGFHHDRAALITRLGWNRPKDVAAGSMPGQVTVLVSTDSPAGPWQAIGELPMSASETQDSLKLDQPVWARFVKFSVLTNEDKSTVYTPSGINIWEKASDSGYQSILGEWGFASSAAIYEKLHPLPADAEFILADNNSKAKAAELVAEQLAGGQVVLGEQQHWYKLRTGSTDNVLSFTLAGEPTVGTVLTLETGDGTPVPIRKIENLSRISSHQYEAFVTPGETYFINIAEPPRNVVFAWDTSASVGAYLPVIYQAMMTYAKGVVPGRDAVNMMPFGSPLLLKDWYGEPFILQTILNDYPRKESSSAAEATIKAASEALAPLAGTKAIVLITDAATNRDTSMWAELLKVKPRIFALGLGSQGAFGRDPVREQDLMQDWAQVNGGHYVMIKNAAELAIAFDRASSMLRRPAEYTLVAETSYREKPGPGQLSIATSKQQPVTGGAVELILDASGSMLKRMEGKRRIDIAKQVLNDAVNQHIAPGTPVALRVFGHKETNSCRTDLEIPMKPLDPASASKVINAVTAMNLAKTPIADSLAMVASDLQQAQGRKLIVLVTDGEETCDGDAEKVISDLQSKGIDISLNIVGFAIDDAQLETQFKSWAALAGGRYFSADDEDGLNQSIQEALQIPFKVFDLSGTEVAEGLVGGAPLELEAGTYRIVVEVSPAKVFEQVIIEGEDKIVLKLSE